MKVHHTKYKPRYEAYILDHINEDNDGNALETRQEKIRHLFHRFYSEKRDDIEREGKRQAMVNWLSGLAISFACYNGEIIDLAIEMGSIDENPNDQLISRVLEGYFPFMAEIVLNMEGRENV